jgi:hypothetical protein
MSLGTYSFSCELASTKLSITLLPEDMFLLACSHQSGIQTEGVKHYSASGVE